MNLEDFIIRIVYVMIRKCPTAYMAFGYKTIWEIKVPQLFILLNMLNEEFSSKKKPKKKI